MDRDLGSQRGKTGGIYASPCVPLFAELAILFSAAIKDCATLLFYASPEKLARKLQIDSIPRFLFFRNNIPAIFPARLSLVPFWNNREKKYEWTQHIVVTFTSLLFSLSSLCLFFYIC